MNKYSGSNTLKSLMKLLSKHIGSKLVELGGGIQELSDRYDKLEYKLNSIKQLKYNEKTYLEVKIDDSGWYIVYPPEENKGNYKFATIAYWTDRIVASFSVHGGSAESNLFWISGTPGQYLGSVTIRFWYYE